jgi:hypothetical protein
MKTISPIQQFADDVNAACPLIEAPEVSSPAWDVVEGAPGREYYSKSPYATVTAYRRGFVVENIVTGGKHPAATWGAALAIRAALVGRYQMIAAGGRF